MPASTPSWSAAATSWVSPRPAPASPACHRHDLPPKTRNLAEVAGGDILVAAIGRPALSPRIWSSPALPHRCRHQPPYDRDEFDRFFHGVRREELLSAQRLRLIGDVHPEAFAMAGAYTPVPGGVGPSPSPCSCRTPSAPPNSAEACWSRCMLRVGLTGGLGSGKSTVGTMFAALGAAVIDADEVARGLMQPGQPVYSASSTLRSAGGTG